jgi:ribosomal protein L7/L12
MATIKVTGKLAFVKGIKETTHISLKEAKDICDEIVKDDVAEFDPKKFGWNEQTLKDIASIANMHGNNVIIFSYE